MKAVWTTCEVCGHRQMTVKPWKAVPVCEAITGPDRRTRHMVRRGDPKAVLARENAESPAPGEEPSQ